MLPDARRAGTIEPVSTLRASLSYKRIQPGLTTPAGAAPAFQACEQTRPLTRRGSLALSPMDKFPGQHYHRPRRLPLTESL